MSQVRTETEKFYEHFQLIFLQKYTSAKQNWNVGTIPVPKLFYISVLISVFYQ